MSVSRPIALGTTAITDPVRLGPYLEGGNPGSVGARRLRDMPEVWGAGHPGVYLLSVGADGAVTLTPTIAAGRGYSYHHVQILTSTVWTIAHGLGFNPAGVTVHDSAGEITEYDDISWPDANTVLLTFLTALSGTADLS